MADTIHMIWDDMWPVLDQDWGDENRDLLLGQKRAHGDWPAYAVGVFPPSSRGKRVMGDKIKALLTTNHSTVVDTATGYQISQKFICDVEGDIFSEKVRLVVKDDKFDYAGAMLKLKSLLTDARAVMPYGNTGTLISGDYEKYPVMMFAKNESERSHRRNNVRDDHVTEIDVEIFAKPDLLVKLVEQVKKLFVKESLAEVKWWFFGAHGTETTQIYLPPSTTTLHPEFYPDLGDPAKYLADFMAAPESVLLLAGPPGTGKTTLLRHLITDHKLTAHVIYDEKIMEKDSVFQNFLFSDDTLMVIEDADTILNSRESENNKLMSRFLNVSDGLIKLPNKKLVFTTNIVDFSKVDQALIRPGRCFGVMHTRALNLAEAQAAAKVAGLPIPIEKRDYTIAEIFNQGKKAAAIRRMGFTG